MDRQIELLMRQRPLPHLRTAGEVSESIHWQNERQGKEHLLSREGTGGGRSSIAGPFGAALPFDSSSSSSLKRRGVSGLTALAVPGLAVGPTAAALIARWLVLLAVFRPPLIRLRASCP